MNFLILQQELTKRVLMTIQMVLPLVSKISFYHCKSFSAASLLDCEHFKQAEAYRSRTYQGQRRAAPQPF